MPAVSTLLLIALSGCAAITSKTAPDVATQPVASTTSQVVISDTDPAAARSVHAIPAESTGVDGQTSWIIEPDVPRIPKIAGVDTTMPPHIQRRMGYAFDLAQRGATYSAIAEFQAVLGLCALELDARDGCTRHRDALREGLIALDEADDFSGDQVDWRDSADVRAIAAGHATPVLKQHTASAVDSIQAVQTYYSFAEERLTYSCDGLPSASLALYGLGRTIVLPETRVVHAAGKAAMFHRIALAVAPRNVLAGNELGVLLAQHGRLDEAERMFQQCVATSATPEAYRNLAAVYTRKGDERSRRAALAASEALAAHDVSKATPAATVVSRNTEGAANADSESTTSKPNRISRIPLIPGLSNLFHR